MLMPMLYLTAVFVVIFIIADLMDNGEDFLEAQTPAIDILKYYGLRLPSLVIMIVPICLLLAVLYSLSMLTRHSEITAMRASGISIYRIIRPYIRMGVFCWLFTAIVNEYTGPKFAYRADQYLEHITKEGREVYTEQIAFKNQEHRHNWFVVRFDTRTHTMHNVELTIQREDGTDEVKYNSKIKFDFVFTKGVLIHINPDSLLRVYESLYRVSKKYICLIEYYNPTPVEVPYRKHRNKLFKRDFAGELLEKYHDLNLESYGFIYHRDKHLPQDDLTWFLLKKK